MGIPVPVRKRLFLEALENSGNVSEACRCVYWSRPTVYGHRKSDPEFRAAWETALGKAIEVLETEALRRADRRWAYKLSSPFIERLLKLHRPELYSKHAVSTSG